MDRILLIGIAALSLPLAALLLLTVAAAAAEPPSDPLAGVTLDALGYFEYSAGEKAIEEGSKEAYNRFALTRGYFTLRKQASDWLSMRFTSDVHQDHSGSYEVRAKYYYVELRTAGLGFLTHLRTEIGLGHMPWLDFEEHVNPYRAQGTMAIERAGIFNSADLGVGLLGYIGGELSDARGRIGSKSYAGRWGSWHVGLYNGGGYHAVEGNRNKALEGRLTLRPLPSWLPGLQLSCFSVRGKGNTAVADRGGYPEYEVDLGMLSWQSPEYILTAQAFRTQGNAGGTYTVPESLDRAGRALETFGTSVFMNLRPVPGAGWNLFGRWDRFDIDQDDRIADETGYDLYIGGIAFYIHARNLLLVDLERTTYERRAALPGRIPRENEGSRPGLSDEWKMQVVYQIEF